MDTLLAKRATLLSITVLVLVSASLVALATWGVTPLKSEPSPPPFAVENVTDHPVVVRVATDGVEWRLGQVDPGTQTSFVLPAALKRVDAYRVFVTEQSSRREGS